MDRSAFRTPVVVWINGAFGVGKTTVAKELVRGWNGAVMFDPELLGRPLWSVIPRESHTNDFQDFPLWRRLTVEAISGLLTDYHRSIVVPMTLIDDGYFAEVVRGLRERVQVFHFALTARPATVRRRLLTRIARPKSTRWALHRVDRCCDAPEDRDIRE